LYPHELDEIDQLHFLVQGSYPYEFNVKKRWHNDESQYDRHREDFAEKFHGFRHEKMQHSEVEEKILKGERNPRQAEDVRLFTAQWSHLVDDTTQHMVNSRNLSKWDSPSTKDRINLCYLS
jgi:hypothetical protein